MLKPSPTLKITQTANALKAKGEDVVSFAAGEPDFNTPLEVCEAAISAIRHGFTKYTPSAGIPDLRKAIAEKLRKENGLNPTPEQVVVSCGAKQSVYNTMQVLLNEGDEVILIAPYWMTYAEQIRLAGGRPVSVATEESAGYVPDPNRIAAAITKRTKAIIVNSPCNPTGALFPRETLKAIAALAIRNDLWIISDEIYEKLIYGEKYTSIGALSAEVESRTITVNGCSKTYSMTGWRIGYAAAPKEVAEAMSNLQDQVTSNPTSFAQRGALAALALPPNQVEGMRAEFEGRRNDIVELLRKIPGVTVETPKGAFYVLPNFKAVLNESVSDDFKLSEYLLETVKVATIPGSVFEAPGHLRLTYATSRTDISRGIARIGTAIEALNQ